MSTEDKPVSELRAPRLDDEQPAPRRTHHTAGRWCHNKPGIEHTLNIRVERYAQSLRSYRQTGRDAPRIPGTFIAGECCWVNWWARHDGADNGWRYLCRHERYCTTCGKITDHQIPKRECPDYVPPPKIPAQDSIRQSRKSG